VANEIRSTITQSRGLPRLEQDSYMTQTKGTKISDNGLRYASKESGSLYAGAGTTRSCFKCGKHRTAVQLQATRVLGRQEMICKPSCAALQAETES